MLIDLEETKAPETRDKKVYLIMPSNCCSDTKANGIGEFSAADNNGNRILDGTISKTGAVTDDTGRTVKDATVADLVFCTEAIDTTLRVFSLGVAGDASLWH
ncbi:UNVERIFIED_CONTAM: hypothetical protein K2H54_074503 [Gekko kuhli]